MGQIGPERKAYESELARLADTWRVISRPDQSGQFLKQGNLGAQLSLISRGPRNGGVLVRVQGSRRDAAEVII